MSDVEKEHKRHQEPRTSGEEESFINGVDVKEMTKEAVSEIDEEHGGKHPYLGS